MVLMSTALHAISHSAPFRSRRRSFFSRFGAVRVDVEQTVRFQKSNAPEVGDDDGSVRMDQRHNARAAWDGLTDLRADRHSVEGGQALDLVELRRHPQAPL